jgi:hypothetical protein
MEILGQLARRAELNAAPGDFLAAKRAVLKSGRQERQQGVP